MAISARLPLSARRFELRTFTIQMVGIDLSGVSMAMQVRLQSDIPGAPILNLETVDTAAAEGLKLDSVTIADGLPVSTIAVRINKSSMSDNSGLGLIGEPGIPTQFAYALRLGDTTRLEGPFWALPGVLDADGSSPTGSYSSSSSSPPQPADSVSVTVAENEILKVVVDGAEIVAGLSAIASGEADRSGLEADRAEVARDDTINAFIDRGLAVGETSDQAIALAIAFKDGVRSWLEVAKATGGPTDLSAFLISQAFDVTGLSSATLSALYGALGIPSPVDLGVSKGVPARHTLFTGDLGFDRGYPRLSVPPEWDAFTNAETPTKSIYWPYTVVLPDGRFAKFYSTDHEANHLDSGAFLAIADTLTDGGDDWTQRGLVHRYDGGGIQTETPSVIYNPETAQWQMHYQQTAFPGGTIDQETIVTTAPSILDESDNPVAWTGDQIGIRGLSTLSRELSHTGYFHPMRWQGRWIGYSILGSSGDGAGFAFYESDDGLIYKFRARIGYNEHLVTHLPGHEEGWNVRLVQGTILLFGDKPWWIGPVGVGGSGGEIGSANRLCACPVDLDNYTLGPAIDITPTAMPEGVTDIDSVTGAFSWDDGGTKRLFVDCRADGALGRFIHLEVI